MLLKLLLGTL